MTTGTPEHHEFQTEIQQLLKLLIFSLYTKKEIFLRELISNASDALEKLRFIQVSGGEHLQPELPLEIRLDLDRDQKTFSVTDTGIGMSRDDLVANIGTIARSGSLEFVRRLVAEDAGDADNDVELIGQFGVGFYSVFMVAREVRVHTRSQAVDSPAWTWVSDGTSGYTITGTDKEQRGTTVEIALKDDADVFLDPVHIESIVSRYSNFIAYPIFVDGKQVNEISAIWTEPRSEVTPEAYEAFYRWLTGTSDAPLGHVHIQSDAPLDIRAVLFVPEVNLEQLGLGKVEHGLQLYTRKVMIQQESRELLPDYLRFIRGVVDSEDLTLNVSRETVQDDRVIARLRKLLTKKLLGYLGEMRDNQRKKYEQFHAQFGKILREGIPTEFEHRETLGELLLLSSSLGEDSLTTLSEYVDRLRDGQDDIFYLTGSHRSALDTSPHLEMFRARGVEVLYLFDPVDDFVLSSLSTFRGKKIISADQVDPKAIENVATLSPDESAEGGEPLAAQSAFDHLIERFASALGDRVQDVRPSERLTQSPCVIVVPEGGPSAQVQRVMTMLNKDYVAQKRILELNSKHPLIKALAVRNGESPADEFVTQAAEQLYDNALLQEGILPDASTLIPRIVAILERAAKN